jgi:DNA transformation protein
MIKRVFCVSACNSAEQNLSVTHNPKSPSKWQASEAGSTTMATSSSTMEYLLDILSDSKQVSARRMFGEYCLYYAGRPVGLVCDEQLFLKITEPGLRLMKQPSEGAPFPGARPHLRITADDWDDRAWLNALVRTTFDSLPPPKPPKPRKAKPKNG